MIYLGHTKLDTTQRYLKNIRISDENIRKLFKNPIEFNN
jgi:hypothetical protein